MLLIALSTVNRAMERREDETENGRTLKATDDEDGPWWLLTGASAAIWIDKQLIIHVTWSRVGYVKCVIQIGLAGRDSNINSFISLLSGDWNNSRNRTRITCSIIANTWPHRVNCRCTLAAKGVKELRGVRVGREDKSCGRPLLTFECNLYRAIYTRFQLERILVHGRDVQKPVLL